MTKNGLICYLNDNGLFNEEVDKYLIDELFFNFKLMREAKKEIKEKGILVDVSAQKGKESLQMNQAIAVYNNALAQCHKISQKIGLSKYDRMKLISDQPEDPDDGFKE